MTRARLSIAVVVLPASVLLEACTGAVSNSTGPGDAEAITTTAVVIVERSVDGAGTRAETSARFLRVPMRTSPHDALTAIGAAVSVPPSRSCSSIAALANTSQPAQAAPIVELADVGDVSLEANGRQTHLIPRQLPDVTDIVSGIVYARAAEPSLFPASARYVIRVAGGLDVEGFALPATAPADPADVHVVGEDAAGVTVRAGLPIELAWAADGSDDVLYVDVQPAGFRCSLSDGPTAPEERMHAMVPASLVDGSGTLVVHRLHRDGLIARGVETGEIRFDFSRSVAYVRR